ncbi:hypothetical protein ACFQZJ_17625 [Maribacter chungangensis]|uniref:Anti-sigma factor n=1 Tax=Maribacter chungangensis TaxID=1069117 RepID=A0ABW3B8A8_9FLAO
MEADKFEKHIKSKLDAREIAPSSDAWQRITKELESKPRTKKPGYLWFGIAASIAVILGIAIFYNANKEETVKVPSVLVRQSNTSPTDKAVEPASLIPDTDTNDIALEEGTEPHAKQEEKRTSTPGNDLKSDVIEQKQEEAMVVEGHGQESKAIELPARFSETLLNEKIAEVVAQVALLEQSSQVSDAEVDSLLRDAQEEIYKEKLFRPDQSVDAMALLTQVEEELDQSFRDQIFQSLKSGFLKVRTAIADRNN